MGIEIRFILTAYSFWISYAVVDCNCHSVTGACYSYHDSEQKTWSDALQDCWSQGKTLAISYDAEAETILNSFDPVNAWIGLSAGHTHGSFRWVDGRIRNISLWDLVNAKSCVYKKNTDIASWNTDLCQVQRNFFCQTITDYGVCNITDTTDPACMGYKSATITSSSQCFPATHISLSKTTSSPEDCQQLCFTRPDVLIKACEWDGVTGMCTMSENVADLSSSSCSGMYSVYREYDPAPFCKLTSGTAQLAYAAATSACNAEYMKLLQISSQEQQDTAEQYMISNSLDRVWLAYEQHTDSSWMAAEGTFLEGYSNWKLPTEPKFDRDCAYVNSEVWETDFCTKTYHYICYLTSDLACNTLPEVGNSTMSYNESAEIVMYTCFDGYYFNDASHVKNITCNCNSDLSSKHAIVLSWGVCDKVIFPTTVIDPTTIIDTTTIIDPTTVIDTTTIIDPTTSVMDTPTANPTTSVMDTTTAMDTSTANPTTSVIDTTTAMDTSTANPTTSGIDTTTVNPTTSIIDTPITIDPTIVMDTSTANPTTSVVDTTTVKSTTVIDTTTANPTTSVIGTTTGSTNTTVIDITTVIPTTTVNQTIVIDTTTVNPTTTILDKTTINPTTTVLETTVRSTISTTSTTSTLTQPNTTTSLMHNHYLLCKEPAFNTALSMDITEDFPFYGGYRTYICKPGYTFADGSTTRTVLCVYGGPDMGPKWHIDIIPCEQEITPPHILYSANSTCKNTSITTESGQFIMECRCNLNLRYKNGQTEVKGPCDIYFNWKEKFGNCWERCPELALIENSYVVSESEHLSGSVAVLSCTNGYRFSDGSQVKTMECLNGNSWQDIGNCLIQVCPAISVPTNSFLNTTTTVYDTYVEVKCEEGFSFSAGLYQEVLRCQDDRTWNNTLLLMCLAIQCLAPPAVSNSLQTGSSSDYGSAVTYACDSGYRHENGNITLTLECEQNSQWSIQSVSCGNNRCPPVPIDPNAEVDGTTAIDGSIVTYQCKQGYMYGHNVNHFAIKCEGDLWNATYTICQVLHCPTLSDIGYGIAKYNSTVLYSRATITCMDGYAMGSNPNITEITMRCNESGRWQQMRNSPRETVPIMCSLVRCPEPEPVLYAYTHVTHPFSNTHSYGGSVMYECRHLYWMGRGVTAKNRTCSKYGTWEPHNIQCLKISCPALPTWSGLGVNTTERTVHTVVNTTCSHEPGDHYATTICLATGEWFPFIAECPGLYEASNKSYLDVEPTEAEHAEKLGLVITCSIFGLNLLFFLAADLIVRKDLWEHLSKMPRNLNKNKRKYLQKVTSRSRVSSIEV